VNEAFNDYEAYVKDVPDALDSILDWMFSYYQNNCMLHRFLELQAKRLSAS